jgi:hypothetical protein
LKGVYLKVVDSDLLLPNLTLSVQAVNLSSVFVIVFHDHVLEFTRCEVGIDVGSVTFEESVMVHLSPSQLLGKKAAIAFTFDAIHRDDPTLFLTEVVQVQVG